MKAFSFRRMWRFCRLLLEQICFYSFGKAAAVMLAVIVFCCLLPLLAVDGAIPEKMTVTEDLIKVLVMFMLPVTYGLAMSGGVLVPNLMIPAGRGEKFAAAYLAAAIPGAAVAVMAVIVGSGVYWLGGLLMTDGISDFARAASAGGFSDAVHDQGTGQYLLFVRNGAALWRTLLEVCISSTVIAMILPVLRNNGYRKPGFWLGVLVYLLVLFAPAAMMMAGVLSRSAAQVSTAVISCLLLAVNVWYSCFLMKRYELG